MENELLNGPIEEQCRKKLKAYLKKADKKGVSVRTIAIGSDVHPQTLTRFAESTKTKKGKKASMSLDTWDTINKYMNENPL